MKKMNPTLLILCLIMVINALSYGVIIPLMYPYAERFGIGAFGLSILFASFSFAQFLSTPILGRLSDRYGRKPILLICLLGSAISLAFFASATSAVMLVIARMIDGATGGNISVAQAVVADSTKGEERTKAFGLLGATFGFGFLVGPALGGFLSQYGMTTPFWFASILALVGVIAGYFMLEETLVEKQIHHNQPLFNFKKMSDALFHPLTGIVLLITLLTSIAQNGWIIAFQSFTNDILRLSTWNVSLLFTVFGVISLIMQAFGIRVLLKKFTHKKTILVGTFIACIATMIPLYFVTSFVPFFIFVMLYAVVSSPIAPLITGLLSERTKAEDQGGILGINQSYLSIGQVIGPLVAGVIATTSVNAVFLSTSVLMMITLFATRWLYVSTDEKADL